MGLFQNIKNKLSDNEGWFRQGAFTPLKQVQTLSTPKPLVSPLPTNSPQYINPATYQRPQLPVLEPPKPSFKTQAATSLNNRLDQIKRFGSSAIESTMDNEGIVRQGMFQPFAPLDDAFKATTTGKILKTVPDAIGQRLQDMSKLATGSYGAVKIQGDVKGVQKRQAEEEEITRKTFDTVRKLREMGRNDEANKLVIDHGQRGNKTNEEIYAKLDKIDKDAVQGKKDVLRGGISSAQTALSLYAGLPKIATNMTIGGLLNAGIAKATGDEDPYAAASTGMNDAFGYTGITSLLTNPLIEKAVKYGNISSPVISQILKRFVGGAGNVGEDRILNKLDDRENNDLSSFIMGAAITGNENLPKFLSKNLKKVVDKIPEPITKVWNKSLNALTPDVKRNATNAFGGIAGVETYQDENGEIKVRFNPEKAAYGIAAVAGLKSKAGQKAIQSLKIGEPPKGTQSTADILKGINETPEAMAARLRGKDLSLSPSETKLDPRLNAYATQFDENGNPLTGSPNVKPVQSGLTPEVKTTPVKPISDILAPQRGLNEIGGELEQTTKDLKQIDLEIEAKKAKGMDIRDAEEIRKNTADNVKRLEREWQKSPDNKTDPAGLTQWLEREANYTTNKKLIEAGVPAEDVRFMTEPMKQAELAEITGTKPIEQVLQPKVEEPKVEVPKAEAPANRVKQIIDEADAIDQEFSKKKIDMSKVAADIESGKVTEETKIVSDWYNKYKAIAEENGSEIGTLENYFTRISPERAKNIIENGVEPENFTSAFTKPYFANKRTGKLTDYDTSVNALKAYAIEASRNLDLTDAQKAELQLSNDIVKDYQNKYAAESKPNVSDKIFKKAQDIVKKIQDFENKFNPDRAKVVYEGKDKSNIRDVISSSFRSEADRARMAGEPFYKAFFEPFRTAERNQNKYVTSLLGLSNAELKQKYQTEFPYSKLPTKDEALARLLIRNKQNEMASAIGTFKDNVADADFKQDHLKNLANDIFESFAGSDVKQNKALDKVMGIVRSMSGRGALGLNAASAVNNVFELKRGVAVLDTKSAEEAVKNVKAGINYTQKYGIDSKTSTALERGRGKTKIGKVVEKADKGLFYMFDASENLKDNFLLAGFEAQGKSKGLTGDNLERYVIQKFDQYAIKYGKGQDVGLFKNNLFKTLFQFGQYPLKDTIIAYDKIGGALTGDKGDTAYALKYAFASVAQMMLFKSVLGTVGLGGQTGTPIDFISNLSKGEISTSPALQALIGLGQNATDSLLGIEQDDYTQAQRDKNIKRAAGTAIIPASNQLIFKTGATADNQITGYQEKFGGNVANPVSRDIGSLLKTGVFGPSYDPKRQAYIKDYLTEGKGGLDKSQSTVFKSLPKNKRQAYYDEQVALNKQKAGSQKSIEALTTGTEVKQPNLIQKILGKKAPEDLSWKIPEASTPQAEVAVAKKQIKDVMDSGNVSVIPDESLKWYFFGEVDSLPEGTASEKQNKTIERFKKLDSIYSSETLDQETKDRLIKQSGVPADEIEYYSLAKDDATVKAMRQEEKLSTMDRLQWLSDLEDGRRLVGNKQIVDNTTLDQLYERGVLSDAERDYLKAVKYDPATSSYYLDRDYKSGLASKSVAAKKKKLADYLKVYEEIHKGVKDKFSIEKLLTSKIESATPESIGGILASKKFSSKTTPKAPVDSTVKRVTTKYRTYK